MSADLFHENDPVHIDDHHQQAKLVSTEVEYDSVLRKDAGARIAVLNVLRPLPVRLLDFSQPRLNGSSGLNMPGDEVLKPLPTVDPHQELLWIVPLQGAIAKFPKREHVPEISS